MNQLQATGKTKGILLLHDPPSQTGWSPASQIPNSQWGLNNDFVWNPLGDDLNFQNIPFPIFALSKEESEHILKLSTNSSSYPRHAVQFSAFMHATMDTKTCIRRQKCLPLGGSSVWSSFSHEVGTKPIIMVMVNIDSNALFHDLAIGTESTASGIIGVLGAAMALQNVADQFANDIVFAFWSGESWGYIGSKKFAYDIVNFTCHQNDSTPGVCAAPWMPDTSFQRIKLDNVIAAIELNQIGLTSTTPTLYVHQQQSLQNPTSNSISELFVNVSQASSLSTKISKSTVNQLPPSSVMSFLAANPKLPAVVITDHDQQYINNNYHSHMDSGEFVPLSNSTLCDASTLLAQTLYLLATNQNVEQAPDLGSIKASCEFVNVLIECLTTNFSCDYVSKFYPYGRSHTPSYYTGVFGSSIYNQGAIPAAIFIHDLIANITNFNRTANCSDCASDQQCIAGGCVSSDTHYHPAISTAFGWDDGKWAWTIVDESQPMWTESYWDTVGVQIFLRDSPTKEAVFLTAGLIEFVGSLVGVFYAKRYFLRNYKIY